MENYKNLLEKARKAYKNCVTGAEKRRLESIFPELKENEDEMIREEIVDYLKDFIPHNDLDLVRKSKVWIAWLEKQGKSYTKKDVDDAWLKGICDAKRELEKQGEKKNPYSGVSFEYNGHIWGMCARDGGVDIICDSHLIKHIEKQGEQKPTDKVEPKFHEGDWVVYSTGEWREVLMVETVDGNGYGMIDKACEHISIVFEEEIYMRLWTIKDAKAGDVLASEHFISIFKELKGNVSFSDYVTYSTDSCILFRGLTSFNCDMFEFKPATVEQRRMLEDKFEKEGLVWDGYRKELMRKRL